MILENLNIIEENILNTIKFYERNNEILDEITINKNYYSNEELENIKDAIIEKNKNIKYLKRTILNLKQEFNNHIFNNEFIKNIYKLELVINKFGYKFYSKFKLKDKSLNNYGRIEYLECYKNHFFQNKILNINEINAIDYQNQFSITNTKPKPPQI